MGRKATGAMLALGLTGAAAAQVPIGPGGPIGGTVGLDATRALNGATGQIRELDDAARRSSRRAADRLTPPGPEAEAHTGAAVTPGTRCYADDDVARTRPYGPTYRHGGYHCERSGPGMATGARLRGPGS